MKEKNCFKVSWPWLQFPTMVLRLLQNNINSNVMSYCSHNVSQFASLKICTIWAVILENFAIFWDLNITNCLSTSALDHCKGKNGCLIYKKYKIIKVTPSNVDGLQRLTFAAFVCWIIGLVVRKMLLHTITSVHIYLVRLALNAQLTFY